MKAPPIRLLEQYYNRVSVEAMEDHKPGGAPGWELATTISVRQHPDRKRICAVLLEIRLSQEDGQPRIPYEISAHATGTFEVHPGVPAEEIAKMVAVNGTSILYSGLRDFIATITGRGPWGSLLLPTVSFIDVEPKVEKDDGLIGPSR